MVIKFSLTSDGRDAKAKSTVFTGLFWPSHQAPQKVAADVDLLQRRPDVLGVKKRNPCRRTKADGSISFFWSREDLSQKQKRRFKPMFYFFFHLLSLKSLQRIVGEEERDWRFEKFLFVWIFFLNFAFVNILLFFVSFFSRTRHDEDVFKTPERCRRTSEGRGRRKRELQPREYDSVLVETVASAEFIIIVFPFRPHMF